MLRLYRDKKSPYWYVRGTIAGRRICESSGTTDRGQAEAYCRRRDKELYDRLALGIARAATWADAVNAYLDKNREDRFLLPLVERWEGKELPDITQREVDEAARALYPNAKASTLIRQVYGPVVAVLRSARRDNLPGAAVPLFEKPRVKKVVVDYATDDYLEKLLPHCESGLAAAVVLMSLTGLRTGEALRLDEKDFRVRSGWVRVNVTKTGEPAMVPLPEGVEWPQGGWGYATSQGFNKALRRAAGRAGLAYLSGHRLGRHAFAARMLAAGYDLKMVKEAGRWKKLQVVDEIYGHLEMRQAHEAMVSVGGRLAEALREMAKK